MRLTADDLKKKRQEVNFLPPKPHQKIGTNELPGLLWFSMCYACLYAGLHVVDTASLDEYNRIKNLRNL